LIGKRRDIRDHEDPGSRPSLLPEYRGQEWLSALEACGAALPRASGSACGLRSTAIKCRKFGYTIKSTWQRYIGMVKTLVMKIIYNNRMNAVLTEGSLMQAGDLKAWPEFCSPCWSGYKINSYTYHEKVCLVQFPLARRLPG
jgi:hypothetical protein